LRTLVLTVALLFTTGLAALTAVDISRHGLTLIGALAILIVVIFMTGIIGAITYRPKE
jgi:hypothetical protein